MHLIFETLAFFTGFRYYIHLRSKVVDHISDNNRIWILIGATFGAFFFSRLVGAFEDPVSWLNSTNKLLYFFKNKTIVGGLMGGLIGVELVKKIIGEKSSSGDLFLFPILLAMIIGRIGCFTSGITEPTYGIETNFVLGMNLGDGLFRHPVALYEILFLAVLWILLNSIKREVKQSGFLFQLFMFFYFFFRFILEYLKPTISIFLGLSSIQMVCLLVMFYYSKLFIFQKNKEEK